jgi:hypothetical protein
MFRAVVRQPDAGCARECSGKFFGDNPTTTRNAPKQSPRQQSLLKKPSVTRKPDDLLDIDRALGRNEATATGIATGSKHPIDLESRWNFSDSRGTSLSLDEFWLRRRLPGVEFFAGKEPWLKGLSKLNWQTFFRVCTQEMDDLSQKAVKLVIEYCLEVLEEVEKIIRGKATLARLEAALDLQYAEQFENKVFQYRWALRHPVVKEAITRAMGNRFPSR